MIEPGASVVAVVTGNGLKDIAGALRATGGPHEIPADFASVERIVANDKPPKQRGTD